MRNDTREAESFFTSAFVEPWLGLHRLIARPAAVDGAARQFDRALPAV